jgi:hypothetical protein
MKAGYEYRVLVAKGGAFFEPALNQADKEGWEPIEFKIDGEQYTAVLRRPRKQ